MNPAPEQTPSPPTNTAAEMDQPSSPPVPPNEVDEPASTQPTEPSGTLRQTDNMDNLVLELQKAVAEPEDVIKDGFAPVPYFFGFEPSAKYPDQRQAFSQLLGMSAITRMFAAINTVSAQKARDQNEGYSISKPEEYVSAFNEATEATIKALTVGPLASFYDSSTGGSTQTEEQSLKRSDIHNFVLSRIFGGLPSVSKNHMKELDALLTHLVSSLKPYKATPSTSQPTVKQVILINYIKATDITGNGSVFVVEAYARMVAVTIKAEDWFTALKKPGLLKKNEKIKFTMTTTISEMKLDEAKYRANKSRYEQAMQLTVDDHPDLKQIMDNGGIEAFGRKTCYIKQALESQETDSEES